MVWIRVAVIVETTCVVQVRVKLPLVMVCVTGHVVTVTSVTTVVVVPCSGELLVVWASGWGWVEVDVVCCSAGCVDVDVVCCSLGWVEVDVVCCSLG